MTQFNLLNLVFAISIYIWLKMYYTIQMSDISNNSAQISMTKQRKFQTFLVDARKINCFWNRIINLYKVLAYDLRFYSNKTSTPIMLRAHHDCEININYNVIFFIPGRSLIKTMISCIRCIVMASYKLPSAGKYLRSHASIIYEKQIFAKLRRSHSSLAYFTVPK